MDLLASGCFEGRAIDEFSGKSGDYCVVYIWKSRNDFVFNYNSVDPENTMRRAFEALHEFSDIRIPDLVHMDKWTTQQLRLFLEGSGSWKLQA